MKQQKLEVHMKGNILHTFACFAESSIARLMVESIARTACAPTPKTLFIMFCPEERKDGARSSGDPANFETAGLDAASG